jgi:signal transduction histidine kinase
MLDDPYFLDSPPTAKQRRNVHALVLGLTALFLITVPFGALQLPAFPAVLVFFGTAFLVCDLLTAIFLAVQFSVTRRLRTLVIAGGYFFTALVTIPYTLTFPNTFAPTGLLGAGLQTTPSLYAIWHVIPPIAVIGYLAIPPAHLARGNVAFAIALSAVALTAITCGMTWALVVADPQLPAIFVSTHLRGPVGQIVYASVLLLCLVAIVGVWFQKRSLLDLLLMVMLWAMVLEIALSAVITANRFSLGHYTSRAYSIVAASVVLWSLLSTAGTLYVRLARSTLLQKREREAHASSLDAMTGSVVHEISQPVAAISVNCTAALNYLAKAPPDFDEARRNIQNAKQDCVRPTEVIESVRSLFKTTGAAADVSCNINDAIREALEIERRELAERQVDVETQLDRSIPSALIEAGQLHQVIINLIANAADAMSAVSDRRRVLRLVSEVKDSHAVVTVEDNGIGIDATNLEKIFEPLFTTKARGMGLGLWLCRAIIQARGGQLVATSRLNAGTAFRVTLPLSHVQ